MLHDGGDLTQAVAKGESEYGLSSRTLLVKEAAVGIRFRQPPLRPDTGDRDGGRLESVATELGDDPSSEQRMRGEERSHDNCRDESVPKEEGRPSCRGAAGFRW